MLKGLGAIARTSYTLPLDTSQRDVNVRDQLGNPASACDVNVVIGSGVIIGTVGSVALRFGTGWPAGCSFYLNNAGKIIGQGGDGGAGASTGSGNPGGNGSDALWLDGNNVTISNTGYIWAGGGGGGGGALASGGGYGGGGGGGRGDEQGYGGNAGGGGAYAGYDGSATSVGAGGQGALSAYGSYGGNGGFGGTAGGDSISGYSGGAAGANGYAILRGGGMETFSQGGTEPNVQGVIA